MTIICNSESMMTHNVHMCFFLYCLYLTLFLGSLFACTLVCERTMYTAMPLSIYGGDSYWQGQHVYRDIFQWFLSQTLSSWNGCAMCWVEAGLYDVHVGMTLPCYSMMIGQKRPYIFIQLYTYFMCIKEVGTVQMLHASHSQNLVAFLRSVLTFYFFFFKSFWWSFGLGLIALVYSGFL